MQKTIIIVTIHFLKVDFKLFIDDTTSKMLLLIFFENNFLSLCIMSESLKQFKPSDVCSFLNIQQTEVMSFWRKAVAIVRFRIIIMFFL